MANSTKTNQYIVQQQANILMANNSFYLLFTVRFCRTNQTGFLFRGFGNTLARHSRTWVNTTALELNENKTLLQQILPLIKFSILNLRLSSNKPH